MSTRKRSSLTGTGAAVSMTPVLTMAFRVSRRRKYGWRPCGACCPMLRQMSWTWALAPDFWPYCWPSWDIVIGIDLAPDMLKIARSKCANEIAPRFELGDAAAPFLSGQQLRCDYQPPPSLDPVGPSAGFLQLAPAFAAWRPGDCYKLAESLTQAAQLTTYSEEVLKALPLRYPGQPDPALELFRAAGFASMYPCCIKNQ
jgi:hypothetical protein